VAQAFQPVRVFRTAWKGCATLRKLVGNDEPPGGRGEKLKNPVRLLARGWFFANRNLGAGPRAENLLDYIEGEFVL
jgi:hypothetical protein